MSDDATASSQLRRLIERYIPDDEAVPDDGPKRKALHALADLLSVVDRVVTELESHAVISETQDLTITPATARLLAEHLRGVTSA